MFTITFILDYDSRDCPSMKDLLPGLEVRLMAHQIIGVKWWAQFYLFICLIYDRYLQDARPRTEEPEQRWHSSVRLSPTYYRSFVLFAAQRWYGPRKNDTDDSHYGNECTWAGCPPSVDSYRGTSCATATGESVSNSILCMDSPGTVVDGRNRD